MLIRCPECSICYRIDTSFMPKNGMKFRCAKCGKIWLCHPEDAFEEGEEDVEIYKVEAQKAAQEILDSQGKDSSDNSQSESLADAAQEESEDDNKTESSAKVDGQLSADIDSIPPSVTEANEQKDSEQSQPENETADKIDEKDLAMSSDMAQIFSRLNKQVELIEEEETKISLKEKILTQLRYNIWGNRLLRWLSISITLILGILAVLSYRYDITRRFPWMEVFYKSIGLESKIIGEGLEFHNISHREYEEDYVRKMKIKGFVYNGTDKEQTIPKIGITIMDKDGNNIQHQVERTPLPSIKPRERAAFNATIIQPSTLSKYVLVTFEQEP